MGTRRRKSFRDSRIVGLFLLLSLMLLVFFLWGRVHIDFALQALDNLDAEKETLLSEIEQLQLEVNAMQQYRRIVTLARTRGLVVVERSESERILVDFSGLTVFETVEQTGIQVAGLGPVHRGKQFSESPYEEDLYAE